MSIRYFECQECFRPFSFVVKICSDQKHQCPYCGCENQPEERTRFLLSRMADDMLDVWESIHTPSAKKISQRRRGQLLMKPENFSEKAIAERIEKQSGLTHIEVMHLIRAARDSDYDLEHNIDWANQGYRSALEKIKKDIDPTRRKSIRELQEGI